MNEYNHSINRPDSQSPAWNDGKERGGCLTAWLIVVTTVNVFFGLYNSVQMLGYVGDTRSTPTVPAFIIYGFIALQIALIAGLFGIWTWKRWGVFTVAGAIAIIAAINLITGDWMRAIVMPAVQFGLLYFLINPKWDYFE